MPYYVYRIHSPIRRLEKVDALPSYREASARLRELRRETPPGGSFRVRMIFAENELQAEDLLSQLREAEQPFVGDDY